MIKILSAENQRGWGNRDHLISDRSVSEIVGREYRDRGQALRAARARRDGTSYVWLTYEQEGVVYALGDHPSLPGRPNAGPVRIEQV